MTLYIYYIIALPLGQFDILCLMHNQILSSIILYIFDINFD